jgi:hypothetical protein
MVRQFEEPKADECRYWQSRPGYERLKATAELSLAVYGLKGTGPNVPRIDRTLVRVQR